ncbi:MAG: putative lipase [Friedmanniella sp.]|nr:putative lipase [Friedmanniella sp.]
MPRRRSPLRRLRPVLLALSLVAASTTLATGPAQAAGTSSGARARTTTTAPGPPARYVALGDSYASGEGLPPYEAGTDTLTNRCHRSADQSYPEVLTSVPLPDFNRLDSVACSGATTGALFFANPRQAGEPPQLDALTKQTRTVTVTIGGNDLGFSSVLGSCVYSPVPLPEVQAAVPGRPGCRARLNTLVDGRLADLASGLPSAYPGTVPLPAALAAVREKAPKAKIIVTGYPRLLGTVPTDASGCHVGSLGSIPLSITSDDVAFIRAKIDALNNLLRATVAAQRARGDADVHYVGLTQLFEGHLLCDTGTPWIRGFVPTTTPPLGASAASFHPTERGQQAYAVAVALADLGFVPSSLR